MLQHIHLDTHAHVALASATNADQIARNWYAIHTCARHEKKIAERLEERSLEFFLPIHEVIHQWKTKRAKVSLPLFPGYIFICIDLKDRMQVLRIPGVVRLVGFNGCPVPISHEEIRTLRAGLKERRAEPHSYLAVGDKVRIVRGPLTSLEGILLRIKNTLRVVVSVHAIARSFIVEVEASEVELIPSVRTRTGNL